MASGFLNRFAGRAAAAPRTAEPASGIERVADRLRILDEAERAGIAWLWATDAAGKLIYLSDRALAALGKDIADLVDQPFDRLFQVDENADYTSRSLSFQLKGRTRIHDQTVRFAHGVPANASCQTWWSINGLPQFDEAGEFQGFRGNASDITVDYERQIADSRMADFDSLTGLANRHNLDRLLDRTLAAYRSAGRSCALLMLDLDKFKHVNDTLGHQAGDNLLQQVADRLLAVVGERGTVGRLGGDEFQIVVPDEDDRGTLGELAEKIINLLSQPFPIENKRAVICTSVGIAVAPFDGAEREDLVRSTDLALYAAKHGGRGQFRFYSADLKNEEEERQELLDDLRDALQNDTLDLHYQPVVCVDTSRVVCLEALMRWEHPERGFVSPGVFIPVAEESDLINLLGEWALRRACGAALAWPRSVRVAVNVSPVQFANPGFVTVVASALAHSGLPPERLELELVESVFMGDSEAAERTFAALKGLGVRLALDDFGTGFSSLSYLRAAPFDKIKVDKSFVDSCTQSDRNSAKIIAAIIGLSNALNMETTVEGVEAFDQLEVVCERGAKLIQGFIYSRPLPEAEVNARIASGEFLIKPDGPETYRPDRRSVFRRIGVIHEDYYYNAVMRDISRIGAGVEGIVGLEPGTPLVLDLGEGQLIVCTVKRVNGAAFGVEFEASLVNDGAGGLCTRHRVSPYTIAAAGLPARPGTAGPTEGKRNESKPPFMEVAVGASAQAGSAQAD